MRGEHNILLNAKEIFEALSLVELLCEMQMLLQSPT